MIEIAGLVVAGVTALGTIVQAFYTAREKNRKISRASLKKAEALIEAFRAETGNETEREKQVEAARQQICRFLKQVRKFNAGQLPTKRLKDLWVSNRCPK